MGRVNEEPRSIARISTSVSFDGGTVMTWTADNPLNPSFEIDGPRPNLGPFLPEALYRMPEPDPVRFAVEFHANWQDRGLVHTAVPPGSAVTVSRDDLRQVYEYARHFDVDSDSAMTRVRSALGLPSAASYRPYRNGGVASPVSDDGVNDAGMVACDATDPAE